MKSTKVTEKTEMKGRIIVKFKVCKGSEKYSTVYWKPGKYQGRKNQSVGSRKEEELHKNSTESLARMDYPSAMSIVDPMYNHQALNQPDKK